MGGTSLKRGTRYCAIVPFRIWPLANSDRLEQRAAESLDDRAFDLIAQAIRVDDRAALEHHDDARDDEAAGRRRHLGGGGDVAALLGAAGDAERATGCEARGQPECFAAAVSTARIRSSSRCRSRNSTASTPSARAIASMCISRA